MTWHREGPSGVRIATKADADAVFALVMASAAAGHTIGNVSPAAVRTAVDEAFEPSSMTVVALAEINGEAVGMVALRLAKMWYSDETGHYWTELGLYVREGARASRCAVKLLRFVRWWSAETAMPVYFSLAPTADFERKERLFNRFAKRVGSLYRFDAGKEIA